MDKLINDFSIGLFFMQAVILIILILLMKKYAWKPILNSLSERENGIQEALAAAEMAKLEMQALQAQNDNLIKEARIERDAMIKDAKETATQMIEAAKSKSSEEADKIILAARESINAEKAQAISELKAQMANFSLEIADRIIRTELASDDKQQALASKLAEEINLN